MNVQEIIVGLIVLVCLCLIGKRIVHYIKRIKENKPSCGGCGSDCGSQCPFFSATNENEKKSDF